MIQINPNRKIESVLPDASDRTATNEFETLNGGLVKALSVEFSPVQDLHGYTKPWAEGAGKNKLENNATSGGIFTVNSDGTVAINSSSVSNSTIDINSSITITDNMILNGCPSGGSGSRYQLVAKVGDTYLTDSGSGVNLSPGTYRIYILVVGNYDATGLVFKPMLRLSSIADPTFEPYSNICPISGHTDAESDINGTTYTTSLGSTYYGGEVEQVSGEGESIYGIVTLDGSETWFVNGTSGYGITAGNSGITDCKSASSANTWCLSNLFERGTTTWQDAKFGIDNKTIWIGDAGLSTFGGLDEFKAVLTNSPLTICYELAAPTSLTLTGQSITANTGINNVSAPLSGQNIKTDGVVYKEMFSWQDVVDYVQSQA